MARPLRIEYPGAVYHITGRGNERKAVFKSDEDRLLFLDILAQVNERYNWICHAYCLMDNHYHLLIETPDGNLALGMRHLNGVYTQAFNRHHSRSGHLFQGRYKAILIQKDSHLLEVCRYVVLNPVRSKTVKTSGQWRWSSYQATAGIGQLHICLTDQWILSQFDSREGYRRFVEEGMGNESVWHGLKAQSVLGRDSFVENLRTYTQGHKGIQEIPRSQRFLGRPSLETIFIEETLHDIRKRDERIVEAVMQYGYRQCEIADHLGMHFTSISRILRGKKGTLRK